MNLWDKIIFKFSTTKSTVNNNDIPLQLEKALEEFKVLYNARNDFIEPQSAEVLRSKWIALYNTIDNKTKSFSYKFGFTNKHSKVLYSNFLDLYTNCLSKTYEHNAKIAETRIDEISKIITPVEGKRLDNQQLSCIAKNVKSHLVLAGAGTGKTSTIIGYIKYLLATHKCTPDEILVLSFTNASAKEMEERIFSETGFHLDASTFHKLGINIITEVEGRKPLICQTDLRQFIKNNLPSYLKNQNYLSKLCDYLTYSSTTQKSEFDFSTETEYKEYLKANPPITLRGEQVKSYGEMDIANFLFQNGIDYVYEKSYFIDTRTKKTCAISSRLLSARI